MEHSIELVLDLRPSPDLADETVKALGALVEEASSDSRLEEVARLGPKVRVAQKEPGTIVSLVIVGITFVFVTAPAAVHNIRSFIRYCADRLRKQRIPLHKFEVKLDGNPIMKLEAPAAQLLRLDADDIAKSLETLLKQANES